MSKSKPLIKKTKKITSFFIGLMACIPFSFAVLPTPLLTSPLDGATKNRANDIVNWYSVPGATDYEFKM